ncbi:MAG: hypothetical protein ABI543_00610 [Ignavibacteria bacterium]
MKHTKSYKILILLLLTAIFHGCIDDPVKYNGSMIDGAVYDQFGMNYANMKVSVGDYPIVATDVYGKFSLENNQFPYNITVSDIYSSTNKYIGLTIPNPVLTTLEDHGNSNFCYVKVIFPEITSEYDEAVIKFISIDKNTQFDDKASYMDPYFGMWVNIPYDKSSISGKLIFLQYKMYSDHTVHSFKKFGIKDITLNNGYSNQEITFTENDVSYNPPELLSEFNIQLSPEFNEMNSSVSLIFPGMDNNSAIELPSSYFGELYGYVITPELPNVNYIVKFTNYASVDNYQLFSVIWDYINPGENVALNHNKSLTLLQPINEVSNVNDNTKFIFSDTEPGGIYVYKITPDLHFDYHHTNIITDKYPLTLKDFKTWGYQFIPNTKYYWGVVKYPGYKNIDEFVSSQLKEDTVYKKIPASEWYSFTIR